MIIFINGSINSGKTTVSKLLSEKLERSAVLEIDALRNFIASVPLEEAIPINWENAFLIIKNLVKHDFHVIVPYPVSQKNYGRIMENLTDLPTEMYFFTLAPSLERALTNRGTRELDEWETNRIKYHYEIGIHKPSFGTIIDNTDQTPEVTTQEILDYLKP